jgi:hypothetical protein
MNRTAPGYPGNCNIGPRRIWAGYRRESNGNQEQDCIENSFDLFPVLHGHSSYGRLDAARENLFIPTRGGHGPGKLAAEDPARMAQYFVFYLRVALEKLFEVVVFFQVLPVIDQIGIHSEIGRDLWMLAQKNLELLDFIAQAAPGDPGSSKKHRRRNHASEKGY